MKKHLHFLFGVILLLTISSCAKDDPNNTNNQPDCERNNYGWLTVSNSSSDPYDIYVNGSYKTRVSGGNIVQNIIVYQANNVTLRAEQVSGYILYPTIRNSTVNIIECSTYSWQIP